MISWKCHVVSCRLVYWMSVSLSMLHSWGHSFRFSLSFELLIQSWSILVCCNLYRFVGDSINIPCTFSSNTDTISFKSGLQCTCSSPGWICNFIVCPIRIMLLWDQFTSWLLFSSSSSSSFSFQCVASHPDTRILFLNGIFSHFSLFAITFNSKCWIWYTSFQTLI